MTNKKPEYNIIICDDNIHYITRLKDEISRINYRNQKYSLNITQSLSPEDFVTHLRNEAYDLIILDVCMRESVPVPTVSDNIRSILALDYYGYELYRFAKNHCPDALIFVLSNLPVDVSMAEFNNSDAQYFCKTTTAPNVIAGYIKNYFDTQRKRILNNIFVVYGHNEEMRKNVNDYIGRIGLRSIDLVEHSPGGIQSIFDALSNCANSIECAIILLSADDIVCDPDLMVMSYRARQNVIFEMGFFAGYLGRNKVIVVYEPNDKFEFPSDILGVFYVKYQNNNEWKKILKNDLEKMGFDFS